MPKDKDIKDVTALVLDHGLFLPLALRLGREGGFKRVLYNSPAEAGFPTINKALIGDGFAEVERVNDIWDVMPEVDLVVFPDLEFSGLQLHLESIGKRVWGSRKGDKLELSRELFMQTLKDVDMDVPGYRVISGITNLRKYLQESEDKYVKVSKWRGTMETWHWRDWNQDEATLDILAVKLGPAKELVRFMVVDPIDTDIEDGYDGYCIDGQFPSIAVHGVEAKDKAYVGVVKDYDDLPDYSREINGAFSPILGAYNYRNFFSTEIRVTDNGAYFLDPTCRMACPAGESMSELFDNLPEIIWAGANGELVEPETSAKFSVQCVISTKNHKDHWSVLDVPGSIRRWVKCWRCCEIDEKLVFPADQQNDGDRGWLMAIGDDLGETIELVKDRAKMLPSGTVAHTEAIVGLLKEIEVAEEKGIEFADDVPAPETVIA